MDKGCANQPGDEGRVLDRVPAPVPAPAQLQIGPPRPYQDADAQGSPRGQGPAPGSPQPSRIQLAGDQRSQGIGCGYGPQRVGGKDDRGVDDHPKVLQQRIEAHALGRHNRQQFERIRHEDEQQRKESLRCGQYDHGVGSQLPVPGGLAQHQQACEHCQHPQPEELRALQPGPERGQNVGRLEVAAHVLVDVSDLIFPAEEQDQQYDSSDGGQQGRGQQCVAGAGQKLGPAVPRAQGRGTCRPHGSGQRQQYCAIAYVGKNQCDLL